MGCNIVLMNLLLNHTRYILVFLFISWSLNAQVALPTFQAVQYASFALYSFSSHTFTNCGATGKNGPTLSNCTSAYSPSWTDNTNYFNVPSNAGIQYWTVPSSGTYTIEVWGANGGDGHASNSTVPIGGRGARMKGDFTLTEEEILKILVGQMGTQTNSNTWNYGGGGGGGTFVAKSDNTALIVAGGGGGAAIANNGNIDGTTSTTGLSGGYTGGSGTAGSGGTNGGGGGVGLANSGAAGFTGNGIQGGTYGELNPSARSFVNGGTGQNTSNPDGNCCGGNGGFGGGAAGYGPGGGGGGYSGGGGGGGCCSSLTSGGGGGGSYNNGSNQSNSSGVRTGHGQVIITRI